ncbi:diguanylate cyclase [Aliiglaciecola sp. 3_MG-2023]|uniref:sensor domain-containing diguanylate cyclase n=1 Tax=Aliiglaciecola sp. 3_MG-2023 TaxID=3062644 RepID=UPI0026E39800|nr:diguanylate cyclase [Aliiglaciecola sp. 3_MG-2023]MDO6694969.1 diguanylate cyclase [Aliiglaciecola sp. 3_MG-2023]
MINIHGLGFRFSLFLIAASMLVVFTTAEFFYRATYEHEISEANHDIEELYRTVDATASIAAFLEDEDLAKEAINGLVTSEKILAASIKSDALYYQLNVTEAINKDTQSRAFVVRHPFIPEESLAEVNIYPNLDHIIRQAEKISTDNSYSLYASALVVGIVALLITYYIIISPMIRVGRSLHKITPSTTQRIAVPKYHTRSEIGALVRYTNLLLSKVEEQFSQERQLREEIEFLEYRFRMLFENAKSATVLMTESGIIELKNNAFIDLVGKIGLAKKQDYGELLEELFENPAAIKASLLESFERNEFATGEFKLKSANSKNVMWVQLIASPLITEDGERFYQITLNDISNRKHELQKLALQADFDSLTGIYNRNGGEKLIAKLMNKGHQFALALIDLNGFKAVNDIFGHDAGDEVLIFVSEQLKDKIRKNDVAIRWGGDEFVLLLQAEDEASVKTAIAKVNDGVKQPFYFNHDKTPTVVSMSVGVAFYPRMSNDMNTLIKLADIAMYQAKQNKVAAPDDYLIFAQPEALNSRDNQ